MLESLFDKVAGPRSCSFLKKRLQHWCFLVNIEKIVRTPILKNNCERLLLRTSHVYLLSFSNSYRIITSCSAFVSTWHNCVISVDKKCKEVWRHVKYCTIQITCTENIGNRVKQCENLKKKLEGVITSCFSTFNIVTKSHVLSVRLTDLVGFSRFLPS